MAGSVVLTKRQSAKPGKAAKAAKAKPKQDPKRKSSTKKAPNANDNDMEVDSAANTSSSTDPSLARAKLWIDDVVSAFQFVKRRDSEEPHDPEDLAELLKPMVMAVSFCFQGSIAMTETLTSTGEPVVVKSWSVLRLFLQQMLRGQQAQSLSTDSRAISLKDLISRYGVDALSRADEPTKMQCFKVVEEFLKESPLKQSPQLHPRARLLCKSLCTTFCTCSKKPECGPEIL